MTLVTQKSKESNTFRFKSFTERVNQIDIRRTALYYIGHENEELLERDQTYFQQTIQKWLVLNLTKEFKDFSKKCRDIVTLPQLIHKKDFIVDFLLEKLSTATTLSLQPLLECLVVLSKDLREEFYPYFQRVLDRLICLLNTQDADQLEWTLVCLAFLFKTLKPFLKKNISVVFHSILPLLDEDRWSDQVINFAVECFAFIARDMVNQDKLLEVIINSVDREGKAGINGCGRLFFEIIRGINVNFHSIASKFLPFLFKSLINPNLNRNDILYEIIHETCLNTLGYINPTNMSVYWKALCEASEKAIKVKVNNNLLIKLIELIGVSVEYKSGKYLNESEIIVENILKIIETYNESEEVLLKASALVCCILLLHSSKITQLDLSRMCKKMLSVQYRSVFEHFVWNIKTHPQFEILVFPSFLKFFEANFDENSLSILAQIVQFKSPMCEDSRSFEDWKKFKIFIKKETQQKFLSLLENSVDHNVKEQYLLTVLILPHIENLENERFETILKNDVEKMANLINKTNSESEIQKNLFILGLLVKSLFHMGLEAKNVFTTQLIDIVLPYCSHEKFINALKILNLILAYHYKFGKVILTVELYEKLHLKISNNLYSPLQDLRSLTSHTLNYFNCVKSLGINNIFEIFYKIEAIKLNVQTYREQIVLINKFLPEGEILKNINRTEIIFDCVKMLLGLLYYNFKLIWEPTLKTIVELVNSGISINEFWDIYKLKIEQAARIINKEESDPAIIVLNKEFETDILQETFCKNIEHQAGIDYNNYRNLLWSKMPEYGLVSEMKNRDIVTIFLKFVKEEYKVFQEQKILTWNLKETKDASFINLEDEEDMITSSIKSNRKPKSDNSFKTVINTLGIKLNVFKNQSNPKQMHREHELYELYLDLLSGTNPFLQKLALDCVMAYKNNSLIPYKDHLYNLIDEKKFKDEMVNFKIDKESNDIQLQHRPDMMKILLRLLYGKMITKAMQKNINNQVRKSLVLRFLGGCEKEEIFWFLKMALKNYGSVIEQNLEEMLATVENDFDLGKVWSARKLQSTLNLIELIHKNFGGLMDTEFLIFMLNIILFVGLNCEKVLQHSDKISNNKISVVFKNVKTLALQSLIHFTKHFDEFDWKDKQIDTINDIFIWPHIQKLPSDCIHSPTPLLKLLCSWSENVKHFTFLVKESKIGLIPFKFVIDLLLIDKAKPIIRKTILEMIERILMTNQDENGRFDTKSIGAIIVRPYLTQILKRLKINLSVKRGKQKLDKRDMNILSCLTHMVEDNDTCDSLIQIFLPILIAKTKMSTSDEILQQAILTLCNLVKKLNNPEVYVRKICLLFVEVKEVTSRKLLCNLLDSIAKKCKSPHLIESARVVTELNAWDKRWIEQPDYDRRITIMKTFNKNWDTEKLNMDLGILVICNCFHFLKNDKDMGLRDNASELLKILIPKLLKDNQHLRKDIDFLIGEILLDIIRKIIRDNNDSVRNEGILLLGEMAKECHMFHPILNDLFRLGDENDEEIDFFKNITHLQAQRHAKGLQRFCNVSKGLTEAPNHRTLTQFLLPLTSRYLLNEKYASKHVLVDAAIEAVGVICHLLPWQQYQTVLKFYLQKMRFTNEYQKQAVRIVVTILDAFHFDLTNGNVDESMIQNFKRHFATEVKVEEMKNVDEVLDKIKVQMEKKQADTSSDMKMEVDIEKEEDENNRPIEEDEADEESDEESLDEALAEIQDEKEDTETKNSVNIMATVTVLGSSAAKKVMHTIASILVPTLNHSITEKSSHDTKHKLNRKRFSIEREEEETLRVPIALALVKLLQKLPKEVLDTSLPGVFMKVCTFLKSPLKSVRMLTRDILKKIMISLGAKHLSLLLKQLRSLLTQGFQVHVLSVTVHGVLDALKEQFQPGDMELCLRDILQVTLNDIFGEIAEEKEVDKIAQNTPEAKPSAKSYLSLHIAARNIPKTCLLDIMIPFKEYLTKSHSQKVVTKIELCFQKIITGLVENALISKETLVLFVYGTISESITDLLPGTEKPQLTEKEKERMLRSRPDCLLIPEPPKYRSGFVRKTVKTNAQANAHILIEFGLEMLNIILKRKQIIDVYYQPFLNPIVPIINESLKSQHIKVTTFALKCFTSIWNADYQLEKCNEYIDQIVEQIFKILHKYSTFGVVRKDDNFNLIKNSFKTIVALLRKVESFSMTSEQIGQLLFYIEQDILETERQPIALNLLKAIIHRKIDHEEVHNVMKHLQEISITSQSDFMRNEVRTILIHYLIEYPLKKKADGIVKFFVMQLNYEIPNGRLSAILFLETIIRKFPQNVLLKKAEFLFLQLGTRLVNEEVPECRIAVAECLEQLISRIDKPAKQKLFDINLMLLENGQKPAIREMAAVLFSRFVSVEKSAFASRVKLLLPVLIVRLSLSNPKAPGRFVKAPVRKEPDIQYEPALLDETKKELLLQEKQKAIDHEIIQTQNCILKILEFCSESIFNNEDMNSTVDELAFESQKLLGYEHDWVRLNSVKIIGYILSNIDCELVGKLLLKQTEFSENNLVYLHMTPESNLKSLVLDLCAQMIPGVVTEPMAEEIVKIFLLVANILKVVPLRNIKKEKEDGVFESNDEHTGITLNWLIRRMRYIIQSEVSKAPHSCVMRTSIFNCFEGLLTLLDAELIEKISFNILPPLIRETSEDDQNIDPKLRQLALRIGSKLRKHMGADAYDKLRTEVQTKLMIKRAHRKKEIAIQKVVDPVRAAKRKHGVQERKKAAKKRKMDVIKGKIEGKKKRKRKLDDDMF